MAAGMKIGILGGTFDPPHNGHVEMARAAKSFLGLDEVIWIPAFKNPLKGRRSSPAKERLAMTRLAAETEAGFTVSDVEISRGGPSYSVETLEELQMVRPGNSWWIIMGADTLTTFMDWRRPDRMAKLARIAAVSRSHIKAEAAKGRLPAEIARRVDPVPMAAMEVSSTQLRSEIALAHPVEHWIPPAVWEYIQRSGLYQQVKLD
jgi:nicotinate-nucleotide adenylyltransferase